MWRSTEQVTVFAEHATPVLSRDPVSNLIYQRIGFVPISDAVTIHLSPGA